MAKKFNTFHTSTAFGGFHSALGNFPKPKPAPAPAAAAPPQGGSTGIPFNATAQAQSAQADAGFNVQDLGPGGYQYQLQQLDFGYNSPLNPFNRAAMLQRAYQQGVSRNTNSYAARGQLYAGSLQNAQNTANFGYQQNSAAAQQAYQNARNRILQSRALAAQGVTSTKAISAAQAIDASVGLTNSGA